VSPVNNTEKDEKAFRSLCNIMSDAADLHAAHNDHFPFHPSRSMTNQILFVRERDIDKVSEYVRGSFNKLSDGFVRFFSLHILILNPN